MKTLTLKEALGTRGQVGHWAYGALDTIGTGEVHLVLQQMLTPEQQRTYSFFRAAQGPAQKMTSRGILIDTLARDEAVAELRKELRGIERALNKHPVVVEHWDKLEKVTGTCEHSTRKDAKHTWERGVPDGPERKCTSCGRSRMTLTKFNPTSPDQLKHLFYERLKVKRQFNKQGLVSTDEEALGRIGRQNPKYADLTEEIVRARGLKKQIGFLKTRLTPDNRFKSSFNVAAAWTRRWSSNSDPFGYGSNSQNIAERHRSMFIADPGKVLVYADLKQAESNLVAHLAGDEKYIEAHKIGDVHTYVTRLVWPEYDWTGDIELDAKLAKSINPEWDQAPGHDIRFQSKRIQHGSLPNYMEVLTFSGWKSIADVLDHERIAIWAPDGEIRFERPSRWTRYFFDGDLVRFDGRYLKQDTTPNHRMPHFNNGKLGEKLAEDFPLKYGRFPVHGTLHGGGGPSPDEARLIAAYWADGHSRPYGSMASFTKIRKIERLRQLLSALNITWEEREYEPGKITFVWKEKTRKHLDYDMLNWSLPARLALLDELAFWDGHINPKTGQRRIFQVRRADLEVVASIAAISGFRGSIYKHGTPKENEQQSWALGLHSVDMSDYSRVSVTTVPYSGFVHSPTVSTGWFLTRKDGVVSITGNSNYGLSPMGIAMIAHIPVKAAREAQRNYFAAFPGIRGWQNFIRQRVHDGLPIQSILGFETKLFGRPWDEHTYKQGLAVDPQGSVADIIAMAAWRIDREMDPGLLWLLAQIHDALLWQQDEDLDVLRRAIQLMRIPIPVRDWQGKVRYTTIEPEAAWGRNWGKFHPEKNPLGMKEVLV